MEKLLDRWARKSASEQRVMINNAVLVVILIIIACLAITDIWFNSSTMPILIGVAGVLVLVNGLLTIKERRASGILLLILAGVILACLALIIIMYPIA